jgi:hypothetical protein
MAARRGGAVARPVQEFKALEQRGKLVIGFDCYLGHLGRV